MFKQICLGAQFLLPLLIHVAVLSGDSLAVASAFALVFLMWGRFLLCDPRGPAERAAGWALSFVVPVIVLYFHGEVAVRVLLFGYPVLCYLTLSWLFASTLRWRHEPLITMIARLERGRLPPEIASYTRRLTGAWAVFFAVLAAESALLARFAPFELWSLFANVLNDAFMLGFFALEYAYRRLRFRDLPHAGPIEILRNIARRWPVMDRSETLQ